MEEDKKTDLVTAAAAEAARLIGNQLRRFADILQTEHTAGVLNRNTLADALEWVRAALDLWRAFMPK
jgi:hypothetical protein